MVQQHMHWTFKKLGHALSMQVLYYSLIPNVLDLNNTTIFVLHWKEDPICVFPEIKQRSLSPNFHIHVSDLYFSTISPSIFLYVRLPICDGIA